MSSEVAAPVLEFSDRRFPFRTPGGPIWGLSVGKAYIFAPNSITMSPICEPPVPTGYSHLERSGRAGFKIFRSQVSLISSEVAVPVLEFSGRRFPIRTAGGPFWSLSVGKAYVFARNSLNVTLTSNEVTVPVSEFSGRRFPFRTPGGPFWSPSVGKEYLFAPNSLTVSPIYEPPVPTGYSHLERSGCTGFGIFRSPVPDPDLRQAVLEPKCRKSIPFRPKLPNRESYLRAVSSYRLHSCRAKWPRRF
ncbi:hypothetical protein MRB53_013048 [Persea americana]|nr:hypothetical protein MRB53_013048 [Persea americana]